MSGVRAGGSLVAVTGEPFEGGAGDRVTGGGPYGVVTRVLRASSRYSSVRGPGEMGAGRWSPGGIDRGACDPLGQALTGVVERDRHGEDGATGGGGGRRRGDDELDGAHVGD